MSDTPETSSTSHFARFWSLWILCGSCVVGFAVFGHVWSALRFLKIFGKDINVPGRPGCGTCDFYGSVVLRVHLHSMLDARCCRLRVLLSMGFVDLWICGLARIDARPLALCGLIKRFAHCHTSCYVPFRRH